MGKNILGGAARSFAGTVSTWAGRAGAVARGAGVDLDIGSNVSKAVANQKTAVEISSSGFMEGQAGPAGQRQDPKAIAAEARAAATATATDTGAALAGLQKFVGLTSDLQTGRDVLSDMARLAKSSASNLDDVMEAAAEMSNRLGDVPEKGKVIVAVMANMAKQGKLGAVEMRDMAKNLGGAMALAGKFGGSREQTLSDIGALFQTTKRGGIKGGPAAAATAVSAFMGDLTSKSGTKALDKILATTHKSTNDLYTDKSHTSLKALPEVMKILLGATGGDLKKLSAALPNKRAGAVLTAFGQLYNPAETQHKGGGANAIDALFKQYGGKMSDKEISDSLAAAMDDTASKAQAFNNRMEDLADKTLPKLVPAFEKLAPVVETLATMMADKATWIAENPKSAIAAGIAASLAKAGIGELLKTSLGGSLGTIGAVSIVATTVGIAAIEAIFTQTDKAKNNVANTEVQLLNDTSTLNAGKRRGSISQDELDRAQHNIDDQEARANKATGPRSAAETLGIGTYGSISGLLSGLVNYVSPEHGQSLSSQAQDAQERLDGPSLLAAVNESKAAMHGVRDAIQTGTLKVIVVNQPVPGAAPGSTTGPKPVR